MNFEHSPKAQEYIDRLNQFMNQEIFPNEAEYYHQLHADGNPWKVVPLMEELKAKAKQAGLWNLFLPHGEHGAGLSNVEYAPLAEIMGHSFMAPEVFNCNAPDTGNMEVLLMYGNQTQQKQWLTPLLSGEIRSAFCMTEPEVASSDATNMRATAVEDGDEILINGRKWWSTGIGHPSCKILVFMGLTDPDAPKHSQHSMILVPKDAPGVTVVRLNEVFRDQDPPSGHGEVLFENVRVHKENVIAGLGRGFEIAQGRLGPGRIHHCMRAIGASERAFRLMCERAMSRVAFGKPLAELGGNKDIIANARIAIDQARLLTLKAAHLLDTKGVKGAMSEIAMIKVVAPNVCQMVADQAIQMHGGAGLCEDFPLTSLFAYARTLRIADGPDEVHRAHIAKLELKKLMKRKIGL